MIIIEICLVIIVVILLWIGRVLVVSQMYLNDIRDQK